MNDTRPFPWRPGMLVRLRKGWAGIIPKGALVRIISQARPRVWNVAHQPGIRVYVCPVQQYLLGEPDLTDGATKGALLDAIREERGDPTLSLIYDPQGCFWAVVRFERDGLEDARVTLGTGQTGGEALMAAWRAAP